MDITTVRSIANAVTSHCKCSFLHQTCHQSLTFTASSSSTSSSSSSSSSSTTSLSQTAPLLESPLHKTMSRSPPHSNSPSILHSPFSLPPPLPFHLPPSTFHLPLHTSTPTPTDPLSRSSPRHSLATPSPPPLNLKRTHLGLTETLQLAHDTIHLSPLTSLSTNRIAPSPHLPHTTLDPLLTPKHHHCRDAVVSLTPMRITPPTAVSELPPT
ncbi:hypothetical protein TcWFU_007214 [Taenia crassiceps]|uniref:Uncharacterized protein n=1 Tax=Taenia crassiceps TaxID=6207 RepID=A0ABR4Q777_9CEST